MAKSLDHIDRTIIESLEHDGRSSLAEIGQKIGMSGPAIGERLRRLKELGVIDGFGVHLNTKAIGYSLQALVRIKPRSGQLKNVEEIICQQKRFVSCDRVTGEDCFVAKLMLLDISELDDILHTLHDVAETHTSIIKSSVIEPRLPPILPQ